MEQSHNQTGFSYSHGGFVACVEPAENWYRYTDYREACGFAEDYDYYESRAAIRLQTYRLIRRTRRGVWVGYTPVFKWTKKHFILNDAKKKFAHPDKDEAWEAFKLRKHRQLSILKSRVSHVEETLRLSERWRPA